MKYEILGKVFVKNIFSYHLISNMVHVESFFNNAMGFDSYDDRNRFISKELGIYCYCRSPQFNTYQDLKTFIDWFKNKYDRPRIILKREQVKNFCNGV